MQRLEPVTMELERQETWSSATRPSCAASPTSWTRVQVPRLQRPLLMEGGGWELVQLLHEEAGPLG